jgi:hypothetical protein
VAIVAPMSAIPVGAVVVNVPPHTVAEAFATVSPVGKVSVNATPVNATAFAAGFVIVKVSEAVPFSATAVGLNTFAMDGGATTMTLADAVPPVPPCVEVTLPVVLFCVPAAVPVTFTENVHELLAGNEPAEKLITLVPCVAVIVGAPQVCVNPFGVEMTRPAGNVSVKAIPVCVVVVLLFCSVKVRLVEPFRGMLAAPNALMSTGGPTTVTLAFDVLPVPPSIEVTCTLLFFTPAVVPVTFTDTVHEAPEANVPAERLAEPDPATAVEVPPQVLASVFGVAITRPAGKLSVNAIPVRLNGLLPGLVMLNVRDVVLFRGIFATPNAFVIVGGVATERLAVAVLPLPPFVEVTFPVVLLY